MDGWPAQACRHQEVWLVSEAVSTPADIMGVRVVLCTFPDADTARRVARQLVEEKLAACVNLLPGVESIYRWQGQVETAAEVLAVLKTAASQLTVLEKRLLELHPYEVPEFVALESSAVAPEYRAWLMQSMAAE